MRTREYDMAGIKEVSKSPSAPASADAEVQADKLNARVEAEVQAAKLNIKTEAGRILMEGASRQMEKTREQLAQAQEEEQAKVQEDVRSTEPQDTARLSRQSRWFGVEGKRLDPEYLKWVLEMEQELWESFLYWTPTPGQNLASQLAKLSSMYLSLLEQILIHTMGTAQTEQIGRLDTVLAQKLNLLLEKNFKGLEGLFEETGQTKALQNLRANLYRQTTGASISPRNADQFFSRGKTYSSGPSPYSRTAPGRGEAGSQTAFQAEEGVFYKRSQKGNIQVNQTYNAQRKSSDLDISARKKALNSARGGDLAAGKALVNANRFALHLRGRGNLLQNPELPAKNDELQGFLCAITFMKGQVYAASAGRNSSVETPLRNAINQMIDHSLRPRDASDVYYHMVGVYEKTKNPQKTIEDGFAYAYSHFSQKKEQHAGGSSKSAYARQAGFFRPLQQGQPLEADLQRGLKLIEGNWKEFLKSIGEEENRRFALNLQRYSPWGGQLIPGKQKKTGGEKIVFRAAVILFVLVVGVLCLRFFLGG